MRILILHNKYQRWGGEDQTVEHESKLLESHHHSVTLDVVSNDQIGGFRRIVQTGLAARYSRDSARTLRAGLNSTRYDIVHVHNFFPLLSPSVFDVCDEAGIPVVHTLHNYRIVCPGASLMREGTVCERCLSRNVYGSVALRCYRGSAWATLCVARMIAAAKRADLWNHKVDRLIALTGFAKRVFVRAGIRQEKIVVKPNSILDPWTGRNDRRPAMDRDAVLFLGRLSEEKGVLTLLRAFSGRDERVRIAGDGPLRPVVEKAAIESGGGIAYLGQLSRGQVDAELRRAKLLVVPSEWYEGLPLAVVEAFAHGVPVVASRLGSLIEIVRDEVTGLQFEPGNAEDLLNKVRRLLSDPPMLEGIGAQCRSEYEAKYHPERNYQGLIDIYEEVLSKRLDPERAA
jgi:glycosyltransferase involved in cell wall biosynthesis